MAVWSKGSKSFSLTDTFAERESWVPRSTLTWPVGSSLAGLPSIRTSAPVAGTSPVCSSITDARAEGSRRASMAYSRVSGRAWSHLRTTRDCCHGLNCIPGRSSLAETVNSSPTSFLNWKESFPRASVWPWALPRPSTDAPGRGSPWGVTALNRTVREGASFRHPTRPKPSAETSTAPPATCIQFFMVCPSSSTNRERIETTGDARRNPGDRNPRTHKGGLIFTSPGLGMFSSWLSLTDRPLASRIFFRAKGAFLVPCFCRTTVELPIT